MGNPVVTVVTLSYKKFDYIFHAIDSVLSQTYPYIEYIIADDGSPNFPMDEIEEYVRENKKENIIEFHVITSKYNRGTVKNINNAYRSATGEILIPLSADDEFYSNDVISKIVDAFLKNRCDVLVTSRMVCTETGKEIKRLPSLKSEKYIAKLDTPEKQHLAFITGEFYDMASGSALYIKKSFLEIWGYFDEKYVLWEDGPFLTQYTRDNVLSTAYEIISIKYRLSGVSNGKPNPLIQKDIDLYNNVDRVAEIAKLKELQKRKIEYLCKREMVSLWIPKLYLYLIYPDVMIEKVIYKIRRK